MLSQRIRELKPAATLEINAKRLELIDQGREIINFGVGEPDFDTPEFVRRAAQDAIDHGWTRYTPVPGVAALREAVASQVSKTRGVGVDASEVIITNGAKHALAQALLARVDRGDEVLIPSPYWVSYPEMVRVCEGQPVAVPTSAADRYKVTPSTLEPFVSPRTVGLILNSPNNPTGAVYQRDELDALLAFAEENDLWVLSDEIYEDFVYDGVFASAWTEESRRSTMLVSGVSKSYAMTGWRIGWLVAEPGFVKQLTRLQSHTSSNATSVSQAAALAALSEDGRSFCHSMLDRFRHRRSRTVELLGAIDGVVVEPPQGAFYVFCDVTGVLERPGAPSTSQELCLAALDRAGVALVPGEAFGVERALRLSYACSTANIEKGIEALRRYFDELS
ncbi:MAG: pyridoxal phosphate-dependent aminotransferase [Planctomycetes bacterium]|nr:pyridoxal phosphate-dependent aminotransferase [Planctomycetota bacterium]